MSARDDAALVDPSAYVRAQDDGTARLSLLVENLHCPACIARIEGTLRRCPGVVGARVNLTTRRLSIVFDRERAEAKDLVGAVAAKGYRLVPFDPAALGGDDEDRLLLRALAVAGFAAANVMLLSVSVWAGAASDMGPATRDFMHWLSALIALPAIAYAGRPFFGSALAAVRARGLNMDVPISLAVVLAAAMSLYETATGGAHAYFDAALMLLFFLLVGRVLDRRARSRARSAAERMMLLDSAAATVKDEDGVRALPADLVRPGMTVLVAPGDRVPVDGTLARGRSSVDTSLVTGETTPQAVDLGSELFAGTVNLDGALELTVTAAGEGTLLAEIVRLMEAAEQGRARYVRLADRAARIYAPAVHLLAIAAFLGWLALGVAWQEALLVAVAVLIITCPCALGLAVPAVQVVASGRLMRRGIIVKSGDALERLAEIDTVVLDKTGTLTEGRPELLNAGDIAPEDLRLAAGLAAASSHPLARALVRAAGPAVVADEVREIPGMGLEAGGVRLGNRAWCGIDDGVGGGSELWLAVPGRAPVRFSFSDAPRADAAAVVAALKNRFAVELVSGDRAEAVAKLAGAVGIERFRAACRPADKVARLEALARARRKTLMVGDGLNDAPALAAAHVSLSPARAADISRTAADFVIQGDRLAPVLEALGVARAARALVLQNFALAFAYNVVALPLAIAGIVTPLIAAAAMSASSLVVTTNALRLRLERGALAP